MWDTCSLECLLETNPGLKEWVDTIVDLNWYTSADTVDAKASAVDALLAALQRQDKRA